jgi:oxygen-independent coproporphyrinogen-3 oxidase
LKYYKAYIFNTIYIGGGTPSAIGENNLALFIESILREINYTWDEFTVEMNPESATPNIMDILLSLGVTRGSIGVQSLNDDVLKLLGRAHDAKTAVTAVEDALRRFSVSVDIIYDIPGVTFKTIHNNLQSLMKLSPEHISAYSYTPETGYLGKIDSPKQFNEIGELLEAAGYERYEVSNFAKNRRCCIHNLKYWTNREYIGIGAGAHSMLKEGNTINRFYHANDIEGYIKSPLSLFFDELYDTETVIIEWITLGLRLKTGINLLEIMNKYGKLPESLHTRLTAMIEKGFLICDDGCIRATKKGLLLLDSVSAYLWQ